MHAFPFEGRAEKATITLSWQSVPVADSRPPDNGFNSENPRGNSTEPLIGKFHSHKIACSHSKIKASFISLWMETRMGQQPILEKIEEGFSRWLRGRLSVPLPWCN